MWQKVPELVILGLREKVGLMMTKLGSYIGSLREGSNPWSLEVLAWRQWRRALSQRRHACPGTVLQWFGQLWGSAAATRLDPQARISAQAPQTPVPAARGSRRAQRHPR